MYISQYPPPDVGNSFCLVVKMFGSEPKGPRFYTAAITPPISEFGYFELDKHFHGNVDGRSTGGLCLAVIPTGTAQMLTPPIQFLPQQSISHCVSEPFTDFYD
ncbi:hypothetical protein AVEN_161823-1 [Araneus ventricosus]|uniref:Uncharacterized protein n=1 Tax=Araneus ventricosus TaxID=182803 RepID=A0A4Y2W807_ARAVE|nr:hypothetical protein AVEN_161823-1 [Araneus ventricosus]